MAMTGREWIAAYAEHLGVVPPDDATVEALLALAGTAAHASERTAAPITCYLIGAAGIGVPDAQRIAEALVAGAGADPAAGADG